MFFQCDSIILTFVIDFVVIVYEISDLFIKILILLFFLFNLIYLDYSNLVQSLGNFLFWTFINECRPLCYRFLYNLITYGKEYKDDDAREDLPVMDAAEGFFICDVIHKNESHSTAVIGSCDRSIPFLPRRVLHVWRITHRQAKTHIHTRYQIRRHRRRSDIRRRWKFYLVIPCVKHVRLFPVVVVVFVAVVVVVDVVVDECAHEKKKKKEKKIN